MSKIQQIIRFRTQGMGSKQISNLTGVSRSIVRKYLRHLEKFPGSMEELSSKTELELHEFLFSKNKDRVVSPDISRVMRLQERIPSIVKDLRKKGATQSKEWEKYRKAEPEGLGISQFKHYLKVYMQRQTFSMVVPHKAGDKMYVDFAGGKLHVLDESTGELKPVEVFVSVLGCSQLLFVMAVASQRTADFVDACRCTLEYYGGVPAAIVPDNLKAAVIRSSKHESVVNETFAAFAEHYNTAVLPARPYKPKDKSLVEGAVKLVYQRIYNALGDKVFRSLDELNAAIRPLLEEHNNAPLKNAESRRQIFESEERASLLALPELPFEVKTVKECKAMKNGHVMLYEDKHSYSVPYEHIGKQMRLIYDSRAVSVYWKHQLVAQHTRNYARNRYTTLPDHLATKHQFLAEWNPEFFVTKGNEIAPEVGSFMEKVMESKPHPELGYKACRGILNLQRAFGTQRLVAACKRAMNYGQYSYMGVRQILDRKLDLLDQEEPSRDTPSHPNVRGRNYYKSSNS